MYINKQIRCELLRKTFLVNKKSPTVEINRRIIVIHFTLPVELEVTTTKRTIESLPIKDSIVPFYLYTLLCISNEPNYSPNTAL